MKRAKLRATTVHLICPHCEMARRVPGTGALVEYTCDEVLDILAGEEHIATECPYCGKRYALWADTVDRVRAL